MLLEIEEREQALIDSNINLLSRFNVAARLERTAFYGLLAVVLLTAIPYGTVDPWYKSLFVVLAGVFAAIRIVQSVLSAGKALFADRLLFAPLLGILLLAVVQIIPFGSRMISFDFYETKTFILIFIGLLLTFETLHSCTTTQKQLQTLVYLVLTIGIGSAIFGLVRRSVPPENFFLADYFTDGVQYAQFVNRNHFAFLMEMTLGLLMGLLLKARLAQWLRLLFWVMTALVCFAILSTNSRGGILSAVGVILFAVFVHLLTRKNKDDAYAEEEPERNGRFALSGSRLKTILIALVFSALLFAIAVFTVAFVGGDEVATRIEEIQTETTDNPKKTFQRRDIWLATLELIKDHPVVGAGFGAYPAAITKYDTASGSVSLQQAHNDYLEILATGGLIAFSLTLLFLTGLVKRIQKQFFSRNRFRQASCFGAAMGIIGVLLHSITDFGLHVIVNALVFIVLAVIATANVAIPAKSGLKTSKKRKE